MSATATSDLNDLTALHLTATALEVSEYQIFLRAYRDWYGDDPQEPTIEASFGSYLRKGEVPIWVRHFARRYLVANPGYVQAIEVQSRRFRQAHGVTVMLLVILALSLVGYF